MNVARLSGLLLLLSLSACNQPDDPSADQSEDPSSDQYAATGSRPEPIVVYASYADEAYLPELFGEFTRQTGTRVTVKYADAAQHIANVINKRGSPPADLLLTPTAIGVWRAAEEGALRPLRSDSIRQRVAPGFRDTDHYWTAVSHRAAQMVFDSQKVASADLSNYADLARPEYSGLLCLSSSALAINRSIISTLIRKLGRRPAEIIVRGWVANLALPPFESEAELVAAIDAGTCAVGLVSAHEPQLGATREKNPKVEALTPSLAAWSIEAAGINRHAREPEAALLLLEWLLSADVQDRHSRATRSQPVIVAAGNSERLSPARDDVVTVASFDADAVQLAERARYR